MSAKDQIKQIVDFFKKEPQLKDKTDGMAEGLLLGAQLANDANELSKETDASFKALQREYTENGNGSQTTAEITVARDGELVLDDRLKRDFGNVNAQLAQNESRTQITPDDFEGTDSEKIEQSLIYAKEHNISLITLTRTYDLTGGGVSLDVENYWYGVRLDGGELVKTDGGFMFYSTIDNNDRNSPQFSNTTFTGNPSLETYIFSGDHFIRQNMLKCDFKDIGLVKANDYVQTIRLLNCETGNLPEDFISAQMAYDVKIGYHRGEGSSTPIFGLMFSDRTSHHHL